MIPNFVVTVLIPARSSGAREGSVEWSVALTVARTPESALQSQTG
jgi:hypothetical protein